MANTTTVIQRTKSYSLEKRRWLRSRIKLHHQEVM